MEMMTGHMIVDSYVSNGPYKMKEWSHNAYILMEKNENYYDYENLGPDTIKFALLDDNNAMLKGYNNGELDFIENLPVDEIANISCMLDSLTLLTILEHTMYASTQRTKYFLRS